MLVEHSENRASIESLTVALSRAPQDIAQSGHGKNDTNEMDHVSGSCARRQGRRSDLAGAHHFFDALVNFFHGE